jgi:hypothetical protein
MLLGTEHITFQAASTCETQHLHTDIVSDETEVTIPNFYKYTTWN